MKNQIIYLTFLTLLFAACNNPSTKDVLTKPENIITEPEKKINEPATCYAYDKNNDHIRMRITIIDNVVSGDLVYEYFEKDKNLGKINGVINGDTLFAEYSFMSEGVLSIREVLFLKSGNEWIEGYGEVSEQSGKIVFADRKKLTFSSKMPLIKTDCITDEQGNLLALGNVFSAIKNKNIQLSETAIKLNPIELKDKDNKPSFLIFSDDKLKAEVFLPDFTKPLLLNRKGNEGNYSWTNGEFELFMWKGYVLKKNKVAIYGGS